jgi:hypothetical protein
MMYIATECRCPTKLASDVVRARALYAGDACFGNKINVRNSAKILPRGGCAK